MSRAAGFIAIGREIFDHWIARDPKRFKAWQWLIADAAHAPQGRRGSWGVVHVERGELAASVRILADRWRWPKSNVDCFLKRLVRDGMVTLTKTRTATRTATGPFLVHEITIISICNYNRFHPSSTAAKNEAGQQPGQRPGLSSSQTHMFPGFCEPLTTKPLNKESIEKGGAQVEGKRASPTAPRHGAQSSKHGTVYLHRGTEEWRVYAEDYKSVLGAEPLPDRFGGFWFYNNGEAARPAHQRAWRNRNAFGAAARGGRA